MVEGALAIITVGERSRLGVYRGKYSEFYNKNSLFSRKNFNGEDPLVFTEQVDEAKWVTRFYLFKTNEIGIEWLT